MRTRCVFGVGSTLALFACAAERVAAPASTPPGRVRVTVRFEPVLDAPAELLAMPEAGGQQRVRTARSAAEVWLPPGPATLRLVMPQDARELRVVVGTASMETVWDWRPR